MSSVSLTRLELRARVAYEIGLILFKMQLQLNPEMTTREFLDFIEKSDDWIQVVTRGEITDN